MLAEPGKKFFSKKKAVTGKKTYSNISLSCIFEETVYVEHNREKDYSGYRKLASFTESYVMRVTH